MRGVAVVGGVSGGGRGSGCGNGVAGSRSIKLGSRGLMGANAVGCRCELGQGVDVRYSWGLMRCMPGPGRSGKSQPGVRLD